MGNSIPKELIGTYEVETSPNNELGTGSFGRVYKGKHKKTGEIVAAKCIDLYLTPNVEPKMIEDEIRIMREVKGHQNILTIMHDCEQDVEGRCRKFWIVSEFCGLGNLNEYVLQYELQTSHIVNIIYQIVRALSHLHEHDVYHRDIKPDNLLFVHAGKEHVCKLADFGVSKIVEDIMQTATVVGTYYYRGPEYFEDSVSYRRIRTVDIFAVGLIAHLLIESQPGKKLPADELFEQFCIMKEISKDERMNANGDRRSVGQIMWKTRSDYIVTRNPDDSPEILQMKELIENVTQYVYTRRKSAVQIKHMLSMIIESLSDKPFIPSLCRNQTYVSMQQVMHTLGSSAKPPVVKKRLTFKKSVSQKLPRDSPYFAMCFDINGAIIEADNGKEVIRLTITESGIGAAAINKLWAKKRPDEMRKYSTKILQSDGKIVTRHENVNLTLVYSHDLNLLDTKPKTDSADRLVANLHPDRPIYCNQDTKLLSIHRSSDHCLVQTLEDAAPSAQASACSHAETSWFAVVNPLNKTLNIYNATCKIQNHVKLNFAPFPINAVISVHDIIVILGWASELHLYTWSGEKLQMKKAIELGIKDVIVGIGPCGEGSVQMATCQHRDANISADSLHVFEVQFDED